MTGGSTETVIDRDVAAAWGRPAGFRCLLERYRKEHPLLYVRTGGNPPTANIGWAGRPADTGRVRLFGPLGEEG